MNKHKWVPKVSSGFRVRLKEKLEEVARKQVEYEYREKLSYFNGYVEVDSGKEERVLNGIW